MHNRNRHLFIVALILLSLLGPASAWSAIKSSAGKVTQVTGSATLQRVGVAEALKVNFRDDVFLKDKIQTKEKSFVRVLLGGKALVTVRELSVLTITEAPDHAIIKISSGTVGLSVARKRMKPGEYIEINTPHAIAAVRGTQVLANVGDNTNLQNVPEGKKETDKGVDVLCKIGDEIGDEKTKSIAAGEKVNANTEGQCDKSIMTPLEIARAQRTLNPDEYGGINKEAPKGVVEKQVNQAGGLANALGGEGEGNILTEQETNTDNTQTDPNQNPGTILTTTQAQEMVVDDVQDMMDDMNGMDDEGPNLLENGGFENGLQNWNVQNGGSGSWSTYSGTTSPGGRPIPAPIEGNSAATTDQGGPGNHFLFRDFVVPQNPWLKFEYAVRNDNGAFVVPDPDTLDFNIEEGNQQARGDIMTTTAPIASVNPADILLNLFRTLPGSNPPFDFQKVTFDLAAFIGQLVRLRFAEVDNLFFFRLVVDAVGLFGEVNTPTGLVRLLGDNMLVTGSNKPHLRLVGEIHSMATDPGEAIFDLSGRSSETEVDPETGIVTGTDRPIQGEVDGEPAPIQQALLEVVDTEVTTGQYLKIDTALLEATAPLFNMINSTVTATPAANEHVGFIELTYRAKVTETMPIMAMDASTLNIQSGHFLSLGEITILNVLNDFLVLNNGSQLNINSSNGFLVHATGNSAFNVTGALINFGGTGNNIVQAQNTAFSETINGIPFSFTNGATAAQVSVTGNPIQNQDLGSVNLPNGGSLIQVDGPDATVNIQGQTIN